MSIQIGGLTPTPVSQAIDRLTVLVWGIAGCGKTELFTTLPGLKLWLQFDPEGTASVAHRSDIEILDFSKSDNSIVESFNVRGAYETEFDKLLAARPEITTVVLDSATSYAEKALMYGIISGKADGKGPNAHKATLGQPGMAGYGFRNRYTLGMITMLLRITAKHKRHFAIVCHEDTPKMEDNKPVSITILLGGSLPQEVPLQISEVWHMADLGHERVIRYRPFGIRSPMRSRMFDMTVEGRITWKYDPSTDTGMKIADWYEAWRAGGFKKLPTPK